MIYHAPGIPPRLTFRPCGISTTGGEEDEHPDLHFLRFTVGFLVPSVVLVGYWLVHAGDLFSSRSFAVSWSNERVSVLQVEVSINNKQVSHIRVQSTGLNNSGC
jgi:hypothetical protein